jgi:hypothetical protein
MCCLITLSPTYSWVFTKEITDEFVLRLDVLHTYDTFMDVGHVMIELRRGIITESRDAATVIQPYTE